MLHIAVLQFSLEIRWATCLKDKRRVVQSLKEKTRRRFNVSIAEIDDQDVHQTASLAIVMAGSDIPYLNGALDKILDTLRDWPDADLVAQQLEIL